MSGHELLAQALAACGVQRIFGVLGEGNIRYLADFAYEHRGIYVPAVDEGGAVGMADGYARFSDVGVGVAAVTHGPAMTNALTALTEAVRARSHVVLVTSSAPPARRHLQRLDMRAAVALSGAEYRLVDEAGMIGTAVRDALTSGSSGRGPVVLDIPVHVQEAEGGEVRPLSYGAATSSSSEVEQDALEAALGLLLSARHPMILAGRGAVGARLTLAELAGLTGAWLGTTVLAKDLFRGLDGDLGIVGSVATESTLAALATVDCVAAFGTSLDGFTILRGDLLRGRRLIRCDNDRMSLSDWPVDVAVLGDAGVVAEAMVDVLRSADLDEASVPRLDEVESAPRTSGEFDLESAIAVLDRHLPEDRVLVTDTGRFKGPVWQGLRVRGPESFTHTIGFGALGLGLPCAIGAALAAKAQLTVCVAGDGGFVMGAMELATASRLRVRLLVIVVNNMAYGAEHTALTQLGVSPELSTMPWPQLSLVAEALGCPARHVEDMSELEAAIDWALARWRQDPDCGPHLIELLVDESSTGM